MRAGAAWLGVLFLLGCETSPTQLVVTVQTDMDIPGALDAFVVTVDEAPGRSVKVEGGGRAAYGVPIALDAPEDLPATFGVRPRDGDADHKVTVRARAIRDGAELFETRAVTSFVEGEQLRLDLFLAERCIEERCADEETCSLRGCGPPEVPADSLPDWNGVVPPLELDASVPEDGGAVVGRWPKLVAWTEEPGPVLALGDVVATADGRVWVFGHVTGDAWIEGGPDGAELVAAATSRIWASCWTSAGAPCGLVVFGGDTGACFGARAALDAEGRLLFTAAFSGDLDLGTGPLNDGGTDGATLVMRWDPDTDDREVGVLRGAAVVVNGAIAPLASGGFALGPWVETPPLEVERFDGGESPIEFEGTVFLALDGAMDVLSAQLEGLADPPGAMAAATSGSEAYVFATVGDPQPAVVEWAFDETTRETQAPRPLLSDCAALAAGASEDGTVAVACTVQSTVEVGGAPLDAPGDLWIGTWLAGDLSSVNAEALIDAAGTERVLDGAGSADSTIVWGGTYSSEGELAGHPLPPAAEQDGLVFATHVEGGAVQVDWARTFRSQGNDDVQAVAVDGEGAVIVAGQLGGELTIGETTIGADPAAARIFLHRFVP